MRRLLIAGTALSAGMLAAAVPLLGSATADGCPTWTDPAGDAAFSGQKDETVDITAVTVDPGPTALTVTFTVPKLDTVNLYAPGDRFALKMDAGGAALSVWGDRDDVDYQEGAGATGPAGTKSGGTVKHDVAAHQVVITMPNTVIDSALGKPFAGTALKALVGGVYIHFGPSTSNAFDEAPAPASLTPTGARGCGGGPAPTTSPSPKPTPAPTSNPSPGPQPGPPPAAGAIPSDLPRSGCVTWADATGDAKLNANLSNDPDLDLTGLTMRSANGLLLAYLKADKLAAGPATADGHRFTIEFLFNKHLFTVAASSYKTGASEDIREGLAATGKNGHMVQMSVDSPSSTISAANAPAYAEGQAFPPYVDSGSKAVFDTKTGYVTIAIPVADIEKYGQARFNGALTAVTGKSSADFWRNSLGADTTAKDNAQASTDAWTIGDNKCFAQPVATALSLSIAKKKDTRTVTAKLTAAGKPLGGQVVTWFINGRKVATSVTAGDGKAVLKTAKPTQTVTVTFAGVPDKYLASSATARV